MSTKIDQSKAEGFIGRKVVFMYKGKERRGTVMRVLLGFYRFNRERRSRQEKFTFIEDPKGRVYIKVQASAGPPKTYTWSDIVDLRLERGLSKTAIEVKPAPVPIQHTKIEGVVLVPRMRPILKGE